MKGKKQSSAKVLKNLISYLLISLEELTSSPENSQFSDGEIIAFVECLEITSKWTGYDKCGIKDIEQRFPVK